MKLKQQLQLQQQTVLQQQQQPLQQQQLLLLLQHDTSPHGLSKLCILLRVVADGVQTQQQQKQQLLLLSVERVAFLDTRLGFRKQLGFSAIQGD